MHHDIKHSMLSNQDQISITAKGRYFPVTVAQALGLLAEMHFSHSSYRKRINLIFRNPVRKQALGVPLVALYPSDTVIFYSFEENARPLLGLSIVSAALVQLCAFDHAPTPVWPRRETVSYRAYLNALGKLTITRRVRSATLAKYRGGAKFSNAFKPNAIRVEEKIIHEITHPSPPTSLGPQP